MSQIKKFVDKIALAEGRQAREVVLTLQDAKELRDEVLKILVDRSGNNDDHVEVVMRGGSYK